MLADKGRESFAFFRQPFHVVDVARSGAGVSVEITTPILELHENGIVAEVVSDDARVATEIPVSFHETFDRACLVRSLVCRITILPLMKFLNYTFAVVLGASVASWVTCRMVDRSSAEPPAPVAQPVVRAAETVTAPSTDAADRERLARENAELKTELAAARAKLVENDVTLKQTAEQLEELRRPMIADILSSSLRAELKSGEVVVTGGYRLADGRRLYAFAKPVVEQADGKSVIKIEGRYLTLTDEVGQSVGLDNLATNAANTLQHGEVWVPAEEQEVLAKLQATAGTDVQSYPSISVQSGRSGTISIGNTQLKVTPTLAGEGDGLGLELRLEQPQ